MNKAVDYLSSHLDCNLPDIFKILKQKGYNCIFNSYDPNLPNLIYSGQGISTDLHIGHQYIINHIKNIKKVIDAKIYFMFSDDEKYLRSGIRDKNTIDKIVKYYKKELGAGTYKLNSDGLNKSEYYYMLEFMKYTSPHLCRKILGESINLMNYFYPAIQNMPLLKFNKLFNIFIITGFEQIPYFNLCKKTIKKMNLKKPNYIIIDLIKNTMMDNKMSSSIPSSTIYLNESKETLIKKIMSAKSYGSNLNNQNIENDFCYTILKKLQMGEQYISQYLKGAINSKEFKIITVNILEEYIRGLHYI